MYSINYKNSLLEIEKDFAQLKWNKKMDVLIKTISNDIRCLDRENVIYKEVQSFIGPKVINSRNRLEQLKNELKEIRPPTRKDRLVKNSVLRNIERVRGNKIPIINFAFDKWVGEESMDDLLDLSIFYLAKLIPYKSTYKTSSMQLIGKGAYFNVYHDRNNEKAVKIPKNILAAKFLVDYEHEFYNTALKSDLSRYLPDIAFERNKKIIVKKYIEGKTGGELLKSGGLTNRQVELLANFYKVAMKIEDKHTIRFDLHPNNFVWSGNNNWMFIDCGFIPKIGSDYYPKNDFTKYYNKIWLKRSEMMLKYPIRSVDIE